MGGLEHRGSTTIAMPNTSDLDLTTLAAHEFFHTWNVKNIRPKVLGPFDYTQKVRTGNLWFAEGVTDYYANLNAYRSGLRDVAWLYRTLGNEIAGLQRGKTRLTTTLEDACKQTWESGGFGFADLDYYNKGCVAGFVFDAAIRGASNKSLDDVMRSLYSKYRLPNSGYEEDGLRMEINSISGTDLSDVYTTTIRSTKEVPYDVLSGIGLRLTTPSNDQPTAGFVSVGNTIVTVNEAASTAGFRMGDEVLGYEDGLILLMRNGSRQSIQPTWKQESSSRYSVEEDPKASPAARAKLKAFLAR